MKAFRLTVADLLILALALPSPAGVYAEPSRSTLRIEAGRESPPVTADLEESLSAGLEESPAQIRANELLKKLLPQLPSKGKPYRGIGNLLDGYLVLPATSALNLLGPAEKDRTQLSEPGFCRMLDAAFFGEQPNKKRAVSGHVLWGTAQLFKKRGIIWVTVSDHSQIPSFIHALRLLAVLSGRPHPGGSLFLTQIETVRLLDGTPSPAAMTKVAPDLTALLSWAFTPAQSALPESLRQRPEIAERLQQTAQKFWDEQKIPRVTIETVSAQAGKDAETVAAIAALKHQAQQWRPTSTSSSVHERAVSFDKRVVAREMVFLTDVLLLLREYAQALNLDPDEHGAVLEFLREAGKQLRQDPSQLWKTAYPALQHVEEYHRRNQDYRIPGSLAQALRSLRDERKKAPPTAGLEERRGHLLRDMAQRSQLRRAADLLGTGAKRLEERGWFLSAEEFQRSFDRPAFDSLQQHFGTNSPNPEDPVWQERLKSFVDFSRFVHALSLPADRTPLRLRGFRTNVDGRLEAVLEQPLPGEKRLRVYLGIRPNPNAPLVQIILGRVDSDKGFQRSGEVRLGADMQKNAEVPRIHLDLSLTDPHVYWFKHRNLVRAWSRSDQEPEMLADFRRFQEKLITHLQQIYAALLPTLKEEDWLPRQETNGAARRRNRFAVGKSIRGPVTSATVVAPELTEAGIGPVLARKLSRVVLWVGNEARVSEIRSIFKDRPFHLVALEGKSQVRIWQETLALLGNPTQVEFLTASDQIALPQSSGLTIVRRVINLLRLADEGYLAHLGDGLFFVTDPAGLKKAIDQAAALLTSG